MATRKLVLTATVLVGMVTLLAAQNVQTPKTGMAMAIAANGFLASLSPTQKTSATFKFDDAERLNWHFIPRERKGLPLKSLDGAALKDKYGFGIWHETLRGTDMLQHGGDIFGFGGFLLYLPRERITVVTLCNNDFSTNVETLTSQLAAHVIGKPYPEKKAIPVAIATLKQYEGVYRIDKDNARVERVVDGKLTSQRTGSPGYILIPVAKDVFLFDGKDNLSRVAFKRNAIGKVSAMRFFPQDEGEGDVVPRSDEPMPAQHIAIPLQKAALQRLVGHYAHEELEMAVSLDGDALKAEMTGQPAVELFAESPTRFFLKVVDATIDFASGEGPPASITMRQGSETIEFKRKP